MNKYWAVFKISFQQEFAYRLNFVMWRLRNILQFFLVFFLWDTVFSDPSRTVFGYDRAKILTYVFGMLIVKAIVYSSRSIDIAGEIARGDLSNFLLKPVSYFKYWLTRDLSSKTLNLFFAFFEAIILFLLLRPQFFLQTNPLLLLFFILSLVAAVILYFLLILLFSLMPFWYPEQAWGMVFLFLVFSDFLGGGIFPLDILPPTIEGIIYSTPFPYILFSPLQIYLAKFDVWRSFQVVAVAFFWAAMLYLLIRRLWQLGLRNYRSEGR